MKLFRRLSMTLSLVIFSSGVFAALGRAPSKPEQTPMEPGVPGVPAAPSAARLYTLHQSVLPTGTVVREFAAPGGNVFALTWKGPVLPDLSSFFGDYFPAFQEMGRQKRDAGATGGALANEEQGLVVVSRGRMGHFEGHAYVPALVPNKLKIETLLP
jgi:Protein of unknown function (DUF2844)